MGESSRSLATVRGSRLNAKFTSSAVFCLPRLKRSVPRARSGDKPIAVSTCEGSIAPEEHAAPVETAKPLRSRAITSASPSMQSKWMLVVLGTRGTPLPFRPVDSTSPSIVCSNRSRRVDIRSKSPRANPSIAKSAALPSPTIPGTFSVPARRERS